MRWRTLLRPGDWLVMALGAALVAASLLITIVSGIAQCKNVVLARIVALYFVGRDAPRYFDLLHEDVFLLVLVGSGFAAFAVFLLRVTRREGATRGEAASA